MTRIRKARQADQNQIIRLVTRVLKHHKLSIDLESTDLDLLDLKQHYFDQQGWFAVIVDELNDTIVGSYGIYRMSAHTCELRKMYLLPAYQGKGLGKMMMYNAFDKAKDLGYEQMVLESNRKLVAALHIYTKFGFEEYTPNHLSSRCDIAMKKNLL